MANIFAGFNKESKKTIRDGIDLDKMNFGHIKEYVGKEVIVDGFFFTKSKYGEQVVIVGDNKKLNVPKRFTADVKAIRDNDEQLAAVIAGKLILKNIRAFDAENGKTYTFDFDMVE